MPPLPASGQPPTEEHSQLETAGWGNKTVIRDKHGLGWESGKPQWQIGVEIRAEQGPGCKEELTPQTGCSQSRAKTIRWQTTLCATDVVLNPVHKKSFRYPTLPSASACTNSPGTHRGTSLFQGSPRSHWSLSAPQRKTLITFPLISVVNSSAARPYSCLHSWLTHCKCTTCKTQTLHQHSGN